MFTAFCVSGCTTLKNREGNKNVQSGVPAKMLDWITENGDIAIWGMGISEEKSESDALRQATLIAFESLAGNLKVSVESIASDEVSISSNNDTQQRDAGFNVSTKTRTEETIEYVQTVPQEVNENGVTYVIKYILKENRRLLYDSHIRKNKGLLELQLVEAQQENEPLYKNRILHRAKHIADTVVNDLESLQKIDPSQEYPGLDSLLYDIQSSYENSRISISFNVVVCADSENILTDDIQKEIAGLFEHNGYVINRNQPVYTIKADITTQKGPHQPGSDFYVNAHIEIEIANADGTNLLSYNKSYTRSGNPKYDLAYKVATKKIRDDMPNFFARFNAFIGQEDGKIE
jgi:hypothetical protein